MIPCIVNKTYGLYIYISITNQYVHIVIRYYISVCIHIYIYMIVLYIHRYEIYLEAT